jgi:hypothetical protein
MYKLGQVEGKTLNELGRNTIKHLGLGLPNDELIGRKVKFMDKPNEVFTIIGCQKVWGYNEEGRYTIIEGYRCENENTPFGKPFSFGEGNSGAELIEEEEA